MPSLLSLGATDIQVTNSEQVVHQRPARGDYTTATVGVSIIVLLPLAWNTAVFHWFLLPVGACGILAGVDVVRWLRGRLDVFDPRTVIGCLAFYGFFVAPILHAAWDIYGVGNEMLLWGDWRPWLGAMACLNAFGLVAYRCSHNWIFNRTPSSAIRWQIDRKRFYPVFALALVASVVGVATYLWELGGISGVVDAYENNQEAFVGKGWLLVLAWPLAVLSFIVIVYAWTDRSKSHRPRLATGIILLSIAGLGHFLLLGWYGSRATTIWALFWMAGIVHYHFRKLSRRIVTVGLISLVVFMYFYGFYKEQKRASFEVLRTPALWLAPPGYQRDLKHLLLGDLARAVLRAGVQPGCRHALRCCHHLQGECRRPRVLRDRLHLVLGVDRLDGERRDPDGLRRSADLSRSGLEVETLWQPTVHDRPPVGRVAARGRQHG